MTKNVLSRVTACIISVAALSGDLLLLRETVSREHAGWLHGLWTDGMFFSDLSNLLVAIVFAGVAATLFLRHRSWWLGLALLCLSLTSLAAQGWLGLTRPVTGNTLVHTWVPLGVAVWCLVFAMKGRLLWSYLAGWTLLPIGYLLYAVERGTVTKVYPYPWLNPATAGVKGVALNALLQLVAFVVLAAILVATDHVGAPAKERLTLLEGHRQGRRVLTRQAQRPRSTPCS